jgi:hypothetical protein
LRTRSDCNIFTLLDGGNRMRVEIRAFHGLKDGDLVLLCHFASFFIISGGDEWILFFSVNLPQSPAQK